MLFTTQVLAANFGSRVAEAKVAAATPEGRKFEKAIGPYIGSAMQACIPVGSKEPVNLGSFGIVGRVTAHGRLVDVETNPLSNVSRCFAEKLQELTLPTPPESGTQGSPFPIEISIQVVP